MKTLSLSPRSVFVLCPHMHLFSIQDFIVHDANVVYRNLATWSKEGCHVVQNGDLSVTCACNHLTNFAILMQVKEFHVSFNVLKN